MDLSDFNYDLPESLIAQFPPEHRQDSRLLQLNGVTGDLVDHQFKQFLHLIKDDDLLVFNNTKVMPARLYGKKVTGGKVEILIERLINHQTALAHVKSSKSPKAGSVIQLENGIELVVAGHHDSLFELSSEVDFYQVMQEQGHIPLPPYIQRDDKNLDIQRYQTVYAKHLGAVAAPTAGLHFDQALMQAIKDRGIQTGMVTLHVGAGTFQPVRVNNLDEHIMHKEYAEVSAALCEKIRRTKQAGGRVIAIGTTSVRSLESASHTGKIQPFASDTQLFIRPGYQFKTVDAMLTNFHLPESTLLMLISAFSGYEHVKQAYRHAIEQKYRFFSYGDAMFITPQKSA